eukprot:547634_1
MIRKKKSKSARKKKKKRKEKRKKKYYDDDDDECDYEEYDDDESDDEEYDMDMDRGSRKRPKPMYYKDYDICNLEFLKIPSKVMTNLKVNDDGSIIIKHEDIDKLYNIIHVIAVDDYVSKYKSYSLYESIGDIKNKNKKEESKINIIDRYRDNRQVINEESIKNINKVVLKQENRSIILLEKNNKHIIDDFKSCEIQTYDTIKDIFSLLSALSKDNGLESDLKQWSFLCGWNKMDNTQKLRKYDEFFCHELNLFLKIKDIKFFNETVKPLIT